MDDDFSGWTCLYCDEWFQVIFNNCPWNEVRFCPLCGKEFTDKDIKVMNKDEDD
jgi:hypothetical protein